ncbi:MAG: SDR family oxidoreductase [Proteobacteria bacterium]|nr:SDR family oxidoreductase [Pseudomonadota bacterium]
MVSNAGFAPQSPIDRCDPKLLRESFELNLFAHQALASAALEVLRAQGLGGFLLFNGSKSAFNPGAGFGPYSVPKAALVALAKQYAVEVGELGVRANVVHADRIRTQLISEPELAERAKARGLSPEQYFRSNLLRQEVTVEHVAQAFVGLALAERTTGCVFPVDGGNIAAAPR